MGSVEGPFCCATRYVDLHTHNFHILFNMYRSHCVLPTKVGQHHVICDVWVGLIVGRTVSGPCSFGSVYLYRYIREIPDLKANLFPAWNFNWGYLSTAFDKKYPWCVKCASTASTVKCAWLFTYLKNSNMRTGLSHKYGHIHWCTLFTFISVCVVDKNPNTPDYSSVTDDTITLGGWAVYNVWDFPLYL